MIPSGNILVTYECSSKKISWKYCSPKLITPTSAFLNIKFSRSVVGMAEGRVHLNPERPVSCWEETVAGDQLKFCVSPVLVCTKVKQTAGGGDNITGAGLYAQI